MKVILTIAGSDSSGGAGIQADLKTFEAFGLFGCSVLTVLTAQNTKGVTSISQIDAKFVQDQLNAVLDDFDIKAIKIGMLFSNEIIDTVREFIKDLNITIVLDPVFISKSNSKLLNDDAIENMKTLFPYTTIITPNLFEAKTLFNYKENDENSKNILKKKNFNIIVKNEKKNDTSIDTLFYNNLIKEFKTKYLHTKNTHGTGCSFSSAIAANLALGNNLEESILVSNKFIYQAINNAPNIGKGKGPIAHKIASFKLGDI